MKKCIILINWYNKQNKIKNGRHWKHRKHWKMQRTWKNWKTMKNEKHRENLTKNVRECQKMTKRHRTEKALPLHSPNICENTNRKYMNIENILEVW